MMKIAIGCDHKGYEAKKAIIDYLKAKEILVTDEGTYSEQSCDYPDYGYKVASKVGKGEVNFGILICYTGIGMSIVANKVKGVRASLVGSIEDAILTREHNNSNVLCLSAKNTSIELIIKIVDAYLNASFAGGRHQARVDKITKVENNDYEER